jgi:hypothetical protein
MDSSWDRDVSAVNTSVNESLVLRTMVLSLQCHPGHSRSIESLASEYGLKKRCLYDFVGICSVFRICHRTSDNQLEWFGLGHAQDVIGRIRDDVAAEASTAPLHQLFRNWADPSLPALATTVVKLFFYLSVGSLDLRKVGRLLAQGKTKYKTMVRKLYTVATCLERAEIIRKTAVVSEIQLNAPLHAARPGTMMDLASVLNSEKELKGLDACEARRRDFGELGLTSGQPLVKPEVAVWGSWSSGYLM